MSGPNIGIVSTHYRGRFVESWPIRYVGGIKRCKKIDGDYLRLVSIWGYVVDLGHPRDQVRNVYYKAPADDFYHMKVLAGDNSVREITAIMKKMGEVELYVDHGQIVDEVVDLVEDDNNGGQAVAFNGQQPVVEGDAWVPQEENVDGAADVEGNVDGAADVAADVEGNVDGAADVAADVEGNVDGAADVAADVEGNVDGEPELNEAVHSDVEEYADVEDNMSEDGPQEGDLGHITQAQQLQNVDNSYYGSEEDSEEDSDYEGLSGSDFEDEELEEQLASPCVSDEEVLKAVRKARRYVDKCSKIGVRSRRVERTRAKSKIPSYGADEDAGPVEAHSASDSPTEESDQDSYDDSDNAGQLRQFPLDDEDYVPENCSEVWYNPNWEVPYFGCGMRFTDHLQFKEAMAAYAIKRCYGIKCARSQPTRQKYVCHDDCAWEIGASYNRDDDSFRIRSYTTKQTCVREYSSHLATAEWLAKFFQKRVKEEPFYKIKQLVKDARNELNLDLKDHYYKVVNTKAIILNKMEGNYKEEYAVAQGYADYLKFVNPNNTIKVKTARRTTAPGRPLMFEGMYFCFDAVKEGWKKGCRPIIGLDGCHLKGICQGVLLVAVGRDANGNVYPIAWSVADVESYETWYGFIKQLAADLELKDGEGITTLSDRNPGLLKAREQVLPKAEHRHCSRHLYGNWGKRHKGKNLRAYFWRCVRASFPESFRKEMDLLRNKTEPGYQELMNLDGHNWCKALFKETPKCNVPHNNISETFNSMILPARYLPIISMSEWIYNYLLEKRGILLEKASKWKGDIAPRPKLKLKVNNILSRHMGVTPDGRGNFRVQDGMEGWVHTVKLIQGTCSCRYWQLNGIPCPHVVACINRLKLKPSDFVSDWYKKQKYLLTYDQALECHRGPEMWVHYQGEKLEAPVMKCKPGRPRKNRLKCRDEIQKVSKDQTKLRKSGKTMHCGKCHSAGHNVRTCPTKGNEASTSNRSRKRNADGETRVES